VTRIKSAFEQCCTQNILRITLWHFWRSFVNEVVFFESYFSYWTFDLRKIYYYLAVLTLISIQILLFSRQCMKVP